MKRTNPPSVPVHGRHSVIGFFCLGALCAALAMALVMHIGFALRDGEAAAYASSRSTRTLVVAARAADADHFWLIIGAWGLGAALLAYLAFRFIQLSLSLRTARRASR